MTSPSNAAPSSFPTNEHLVFSHAVEALFIRGLGSRLKAETRADLRSAGLDLDKPLLPAYPIATFVAAVRIAANSLYGDSPEPIAFFKLGECLISGLEETFLGRAGLAVGRLVGPMKAILKLPTRNKRATNGAETHVRQTGPSSVDLRMTGYWFPYAEFQLGAYEGTLRALGAKEPKVELTHFDTAKGEIAMTLSWRSA